MFLVGDMGKMWEEEIQIAMEFFFPSFQLSSLHYFNVCGVKLDVSTLLNIQVQEGTW